MTIDYLAKRPRAVFDSECFPNLWSIGFMDLATRKPVILRRTETEELDIKRMGKIMRNFRLHSFNGIHYDIPMILLAARGATCRELKEANDLIIPDEGKGLMWWQFLDRYELRVPEWLDHIDLMPIAPSAAQRASLKKYAGMMHSKTMMEFGTHFNNVLSRDEIEASCVYLANDLNVTADLAEEMTPQIDIRSKISVDIGVDVRSKSDAQIGEAIMRQRVEKRLGMDGSPRNRLYKPDIKPGGFKYIAPKYVQFQTPFMQTLLSKLLRSDFVVKYDGYVQLPEIFYTKKKGSKENDSDGLDYQIGDDDELEGGSEIVIGGNVYKMGIGGLHSQEKGVSHFEDDDYLLVDIDVTGYYPNLKLRSGREPSTMKGHYLAVYKEIVDERAAAKKAGQKDKAEQGKIASNGLFGKNGSPFSIVYAPEMLIQTTVTGQLSLLMLIEEFTLRKWQVISANTDGIVIRVPRKDLGLMRLIVWDWEDACGLNMEYTFYRSIHSISVNSYMAFKKKTTKDSMFTFTGDIEVKRKGKYAQSGRGLPAAFGLKKTPESEICYDAAVALMLDGTPIETTVRNCQDIRKFVNVRAVKGGAIKDDVVIGKVVRYYYSVSSPGPMRYVLSGNLVPKSEGAEPCMTLPDELPGDIDYEWYERKTYAILHDSGLQVIDPTTEGRTGQYLARREDQKTLHTVQGETGLGLCGVARKDRMDNWIEYRQVPEGMRHCAKCVRLATRG